MKSRFLFIVAAISLLSIIFNPLYGQKKNVFALGKDEFLLNGKSFQVISGEIHPARIPAEYWRHRIKMIKAMGCNTVAAYTFWNYHETEKGVFDFKTGNKNIAEFIRICQQERMWVLLRPGPYVCAEWDFGGLPAYLLKVPDIRIRCMDPRYMAAVTRYIKKLAYETVPLQCTKGGPILMVQVENEYGSYGNDREYMKTLQQLIKNSGFNVPLYTADGPTPYMLEAGSLTGAAIGLDSGGDEKDFEQARRHNPNVPAFSSETYPGWLTHWGEKWARPDTGGLKKEVEYLLKNKKSFNFYVIHGGTNFGFTAGANAFSPVAYQPDITSYDYDAPINENGEPTAKYFMLRNLIAAYTKEPLPEIPAPVKTIEIPSFYLQKMGSIWDYLPTGIYSSQPKTMEAYDQNQGIILYKTKLVGHKSGKLKIWEPHDYALVYLNGKFIDTVFRDGGKWEVDLPKSEVKDPVLEILVEGMGHINFAQFMIDRKGITDRVTLNGMTLMNWETFLLPMDEKFIASLKLLKESMNNDSKHCRFFKGEFMLEEMGDTYFDMNRYTRGVLYVNGHNLGRFWNIGPQQRLYCPASFFKKGKNEVIIFDFHQESAESLTGHRRIQ
ncbi:MAG: beta-galactosidase [Chitinophagaceae bacterium]|nr:beta-galactosidase [Chitinophagaceae bacterium]